MMLPVTLADLISSDKLLWVYCRDCGHERDMNPVTIRLSPHTPVVNVSKHMKCSKCGSKKISTAPELYPCGIHATRARRQEM